MVSSTLSDKDLVATIRRCAACPALPLGPRPIFQWNPGAPILIAGQAPGARTHHQGIPFDDQSGERLRDWLAVSREQFYDSSNFAIVPMAFCFPGSGKAGDLPPPALCAELWRLPLLQRMHRLQLTIILGRHALAWHRPGTKAAITAEVGRWRETLPGSIALPHPSPRNNRWIKQNPWFEERLLPDLRAAVRQAISTAAEV